MYIDKKSEILRELEAEDNAMSTIFQAIIDHGGIIKWTKITLENYQTIESIQSLLLRMEMHFVKLEEYEKALYIKNGLDKIN